MYGLFENNQEKLLAKLLLEAGFNFAAGVPCGVIKHIIEYFEENLGANHIYATRESEAIGLACGAYLAGKTPIVYMQNSGFLNTVNDISSLLLAYKVPALLIITWRGAPGEDAPQHLLNGAITSDVLNLLGIPFQTASKAGFPTIVENAMKNVNDGKITAILIKRGDLE